MVWQKRRAATPNDPIRTSKGTHAVVVPFAQGWEGWEAADTLALVVNVTLVAITLVDVISKQEKRKLHVISMGLESPGPCPSSYDDIGLSAFVWIIRSYLWP